MNEKEVKADLKRAVPVPKFERVWRVLKSQGLVDDALDKYSSYSLQELKDLAELYADYQWYEMQSTRRT